MPARPGGFSLRQLALREAHTQFVKFAVHRSSLTFYQFFQRYAQRGSNALCRVGVDATAVHCFTKARTGKRHFLCKLNLRLAGADECTFAFCLLNRTMFISLQPVFCLRLTAYKS